MLDSYMDVLTVDNVAEILQVDRRTVMRLITDKKLACLKIGRIYRISKASLLSFLDSADCAPR